MESVGGGQTKDNVSGWTVDTLHSHIVQMLLERDKRWDEVLEERNLRYMATFTAAQVAVDKSERELDGWKKTNNEWRGAMQDKDRLLMSRPEITSEINSLRTSITTIRNLSLSAILVCCSVITVVVLLTKALHV